MLGDILARSDSSGLAAPHGNIEIRAADPVVAADGDSYERTVVEAWLSERRTISAVTGAPLQQTDLVPNHSLRSLLQGFRFGWMGPGGRRFHRKYCTQT